MIQAGALEGAGMIFGGHLDRHYHPGAIVVAEGAVNASSDNFTIEIIGQGAHGARPHESIDAVVVGRLMIMALQTIVSREIDPSVRPSYQSDNSRREPHRMSLQARREWKEQSGLKIRLCAGNC